MLKIGWTALHLAADKGFEQIVKILVEHGSDVHLQTSVFIFFFFLFSLFFDFSYIFDLLFWFIVGCLMLIVVSRLCCVIFILFVVF